MNTPDLENTLENKWYALRIVTGQENAVKEKIERELTRLGFFDKVENVLIPEETVFEVRNGKRKQRVKSFIPGYIFVKCNLDKRLQEEIETLESVVNFIGRKKDPTPLQDAEINKILSRVEERKDIATVETQFSIGDPIKVIDGPFNTFSGSVKEVNNEKQKLKVEVGILGRKTPVELDFSQVELENH